jgi:hypothetical protein
VQYSTVEYSTPSHDALHTVSMYYSGAAGESSGVQNMPPRIGEEGGEEGGGERGVRSSRFIGYYTRGGYSAHHRYSTPFEDTVHPLMIQHTL